MPRSAAQFRQMRETSRERIVDAALELFAERGFAATSVRQIAERAGVSQGLLYNYFNGKRFLLRAIFERSMDDVRASFAAASAGGTAVERLGNLVRSAFEIVDAHRAFWRLTYQLRMQVDVMEVLGDDLIDWTTEVRRTLEERMRELGSSSPDIDAAVLFATIDGAAQHYVLDPGGYPVEDIVDRIVARFGAGSSPEKEESDGSD